MHNSASALNFSLTATLAFVAVALDPYLVLLFSPIVLGAPHAISDIWYLIVRDSGVPRRVRIALALLSGVVLLGGALVLTGAELPARIESLLLIALISIPLALVTTTSAALPAWSIAMVLAYLLFATEFPVRAIVAHLHNIIALTFLFSTALPYWRKRGVIIGVLTVLVLGGVGTLLSLGSGTIFFHSLNDSRWSPFLSLTFGSSASVAAALLFSYAFLQLLHFAVWIGFIPALRGDISIIAPIKTYNLKVIGLILIFLLLVVSAAPLFSLIDPIQARQSYLTLVSFHGWMEISWLLAHYAYLAPEGNLGLRSVFAFDKSLHV